MFNLSGEVLTFSTWNSLEIVKILTSVATPVTLGLFGWWLNSRLKKIDQNHWRERALIERRSLIYETVSGDLNDILCFFAFFGDWKSISPADIIVKKRRLDKTINVNRMMLSDSFYQQYVDFIALCFNINIGKGQSAKIRAAIENEWGNRRIHCDYQWKHEEYDNLFSPETSSREEVMSCYNDLMREYAKLILVDPTWGAINKISR